MRSALETGTAGSGAVIHSRDVASGTDCDAAWKVVAGFDATEGSTNALVHDRCGGDDDELIVDEDVLEKVAALAGATLVTLDGGQDGTRDDGGGLGFRFDDLGGGGVVVEPWHPGTASGGGRLAADSWRRRLSRELACLLRLPTPAARVPPVLRRDEKRGSRGERPRCRFARARSRLEAGLRGCGLAVDAWRGGGEG
jgi:hypothetical protein